jgi:predicted DNA-binding protein (UPF0278 family)
MSLFKKPSKAQIREQINKGLTAFISEGKTITVVESHVKQASRQPKEQIVEIEVENLPKALRDKYFPGE